MVGSRGIQRGALAALVGLLTYGLGVIIDTLNDR